MLTEEEFGESGDVLDGSVYEDEAFDEYSDSFQPGDGGEDGHDGENSTALDHSDEEDSDHGKQDRHLNERSCRCERGDLVQVFWEGEREWFSGKVAQIDKLSGRCFVQYDDGEEAWEARDHMRYAPEAFELASEAFQQLQLLLPRDATQEEKAMVLVRLLGAKILVYWRDFSSWFPGSIAQVDSEALTLQTEYDDGDLRWEPERDFFNILVRVSTQTATSPGTSVSHPTVAPLHADLVDAESEVERVLIPRAYKAVIPDHFQPERTARPYISVTNTIRSIITPRRGRYSERRYLHSSLKLECATSEVQVSFADGIVSRDCFVQTDVVAGEWMGNGDCPNLVQHFSQCG